MFENRGQKLTVPSFINSNTKFSCCCSLTISFSCTILGCCFSLRRDESSRSCMHSSHDLKSRLMRLTATNSPDCLFSILYTSPNAPVPMRPRLVYLQNKTGHVHHITTQTRATAPSLTKMTHHGNTSSLGFTWAAYCRVLPVHCLLGRR